MRPTTDLCARASRFAAARHHLITRQQLHKLEITDTQIHDWQVSGFLDRVEREVFLVAGGRLDWRTRLLSVCMSTGGIASHRSAAALHGLEGCNPGRPEVTIAKDRTFRRDGVRTHESTDLHLMTPVVKDSIPTTPVARTVLDLGAVAPYLVEGAARDAVGQRLTTWPELFATLVTHSRKGRRGCGPLRVVLDEHYGDQTESKLERQFLRILRASGLPALTQQFQAFDEHGPIMRLDFAYPDLQIAVEIDSVLHHATSRAFEEDRIKRNRLIIAGWLLVQFTNERIRTRPTRVCEELEAARRRRHEELERLLSFTGCHDDTPRTKEAPGVSP